VKLLLERWNKFLNEDLNTATRLSVFDFDETLAYSEGSIDIFDKEGNKVQTITTQEEYDEWEDAPEIQSGELTFDYGGLDNVTNPTEIVAITKLLRDATNDPDTQAMVVTARSSKTEDDIHRYLSAIEVPTDDLYIKGMGDEGLGRGKGGFIFSVLEEFPGIREVEFYDDSQKNIIDVNTAKAQALEQGMVDVFDVYLVVGGVPQKA
tara:strand:+ start:172 stop:792 length:621 start_codon:yes stop_codon:yes gene_type:complete